jgi:hypothetical protein
VQEYTLRQQLEQRLSELKSEYQAGQKMLVDLEAQQAELRQILLRISGAIQVLEELLAPLSPPAVKGSESPMLTGSAAENSNQSGSMESQASLSDPCRS